MSVRGRGAFVVRRSREVSAKSAAVKRLVALFRPESGEVEHEGGHPVTIRIGDLIAWTISCTRRAQAELSTAAMKCTSHTKEKAMINRLGSATRFIRRTVCRGALVACAAAVTLVVVICLPEPASAGKVTPPPLPGVIQPPAGHHAYR